VYAELLSGQTDLVETLGQASNITILAPNNDALSSLLDSSLLENADAGLVPALLTYHVLNGTYFAENVTETPAFIPTLLTNSTYSNVTGGQVVEALAEGDTVSFYSALKARANVTQAVCNTANASIYDMVTDNINYRTSSSTEVSSTSSTRFS
jgi:uncharacterized surface protein with fasciclin (FAS1) repeats